MSTIQNLNKKLILAPMLGYTDHIFRNVFNDHFKGFDYAIAPYIISDKNSNYKESLLKRIRPENNDILTVPQILSNNSDEFIELSKIFTSMGHREVNWNVACPYPRALKKNLGASLIEHPDIVDKFLENVLKEIDINLSIKLRIGVNDENDILDLIPILNSYPIKNITIHARTASQMYKGKISYYMIENILSISKHELIYSGDIKTVLDYSNIINRFPDITRIMIGRGILINPFLTESINGAVYSKNEEIDKLKEYHKDLIERYSIFFSGDSHLLFRMKELWYYQAEYFEDSLKLKKKIKKCKTMDSFKSIITEVLQY